MMLDNDENQDSKSTNQNGRSSKSSRSSIFASSIFTRVRMLLIKYVNLLKVLKIF